MNSLPTPRALHHISLLLLACLCLLAGHLGAIDLAVNTTSDTLVGVNTTSVTNYNASATRSLRGAIIAVNNTAAGSYNIVLPAGTYTLSLVGADNAAPSAATGDLDVTKPVSIQGAGSGLTYIQGGTSSGTGIDKIFSINPVNNTGVPVVPGGLAFALSGVTLRYGRNTETAISPGNNIGGAMDFSGGSAASNVRGSLSLTNVIFDANATVNGDGGALGLFGGGTVTVTNCTFSNNITGSTGAPATGGAIFISYDDRKSYVFSNCTINANQTPGTGGHSGGGLFSFSGSASSGNSVQFTNCAITNNSFPNTTSSHGGGMVLADATTLEACQISSNSAALGAGLLISSGTTTLNRSSVANNVAFTSSGSLGAGGACVANGATLNANFCRIASNSGTASSPSQLAKYPFATVATLNCWFGTNTPGVTQLSTGITFSPNAILTHTASPTTVNAPSGTSTLTASLASNSVGAIIAPGNLGAFVGVPIFFTSNSNGAISNAQTALQSNATATATFTGVTAGSGQATATVDGMSVAISITINVPLTILENWRLTYFGNSTNTGQGANTADFDKDGIPNLLEFAFGTDPTLKSAGQPALIYTGSLSGGGTLTLVGQPVLKFEGNVGRALFIRRKDYVTAGITYIAQFSPDLQTWTTTAGTPTVLASNTLNEVCSLSFPSPAYDNARRVFYRVKVTAP